jgi:hypothetical protein
MSALPICIQYTVGIPSLKVWQQKDTKIVKEKVKSSLFANNLILYLKECKDSIKKLLRFDKHFMIPEYKINIKISRFSICQ